MQVFYVSFCENTCCFVCFMTNFLLLYCRKFDLTTLEGYITNCYRNIFIGSGKIIAICRKNYT